MPYSILYYSLRTFFTLHPRSETAPQNKKRMQHVILHFITKGINRKPSWTHVCLRLGPYALAGVTGGEAPTGEAVDMRARDDRFSYRDEVFKTLSDEMSQPRHRIILRCFSSRDEGESAHNTHHLLFLHL